MKISASTQIVALSALANDIKNYRTAWNKARISQSLTRDARRVYMRGYMDVYLASRKAREELLRAFNA